MRPVQNFAICVRHRTYSISRWLQYFRRMNRGESERIQELCSRIAVEQDRNKFLKLCEELNHLLSARSRGVQEDKHGGAEGT